MTNPYSLDLLPSRLSSGEPFNYRSAARPQSSSHPPHSFHVPLHNGALPHPQHLQCSCHSHRAQLCHDATVAALCNGGQPASTPTTFADRKPLLGGVTR
ncbi:unnamed protein product [Periconia digitata]|uniref:Uncharacterized protein n=1 Tax=Periconia digitata TaxID=1303443 RepID=A0A9W4ULZ5_9PLEO|nr:unnamed protein product [Periconia digitata]